MDQPRGNGVAELTTGDASRRGLMKAMLGGGVLAMGLASGQAAAAQATPGTCPPGTPEENIALVTRILTEVWTAGRDADELGPARRLELGSTATPRSPSSAAWRPQRSLPSRAPVRRD